MKIEDLNKMRVIVSEEEWKNISPVLKLELIALSKMTGEDIQNNLNDDQVELYNKLMYE